MRPGSARVNPRPLARGLAVALVGALALVGCGLDRVDRPDTSVMPRPPEPQPTVRRLAVVALVDGGWRRLPGFEDRIRVTVGAASAFLSGYFGVELGLERVAPWPAAEGAAAELERLAALETAAPLPAADLVIGFTADAPPRRAAMADLARSRYAGRHVVIFGLGRAYTDPARRRAAEARSLLNAIGRIYGALPSCRAGIMAPRVPEQPELSGAWRWGRTNRALIAAHAAIDLRPTETGPTRIPTAVAGRAREILARPDDDLRCDLPAVDRRRILLAEVMLAAERAGAEPGPEGELLSDAAPTDTRELAAVAAAEAALTDDPAGAFETCRPIAEQAPAVAARCAGRASEALGLHDDAIRFYRAWLAHHPEDEQTLLSLAREVGRDGDDEAARALLARAVAEHPGFVEARLNLGIALARLGRYPEARAAWQAVLERAPEHAEARRLLEELDRRVP